MKVSDLKKIIEGWPDDADLIECGKGNKYASWKIGKPTYIEKMEWLSQPHQAFPESRITFIVTNIHPAKNRLLALRDKFKKFIKLFN